ncbi:MAG TPA: proline dehydrogenase family protein [Cyclobacteriaceae bacterium]|nr:proline dehydrogenase family protein [Cyclobacteriaceae bacterium]
MYTKPQFSFENIQVAFAPKSDEDLKKMFLIFSVLNNNLLSKWGVSLATWSLKLRLPVKWLIKQTIFEQFCGGESIEDSNITIKSLNQYKIGAILDYSVEGKDDEESFDRTRDEILRTIHHAGSTDGIPFSVFKVTGLGDARIMTKIQAKQTLSAKEQSSFERTKARVDRLFEAAYEAKVKILVDGEESWFQDVIDDLAEEGMARYNKETAIVYNTYQMYRQDMLRKLKDAHHNAVTDAYFLGAKLVRGAYMEKEAERAEKLGYANPIHPNKEATDDAFNEALKFCINNKQRVFLVSGTHNELSNIILPELMSLHGMKPKDDRVYFAQLYGMSDHISYNLAQAGYNVAKYVPYGPVEAVMPYLARRAAENTSVAGQSSRELTLIKQEFARRKAGKNNN